MERPLDAWDQTAVLGMTERLVADGIAGVVVPSFAKGAVAADINVVFWDWAPNPPHAVRVVDDDQRLPKDASSWR